MPDHDSMNTDIAALFDLWNSTLQTGDAKQVAALYAADAVLLPTFSSAIRQTPDAIEEYFEEFLKSNPKGTILHQKVSVYDQIAINSGVYQFETSISGIEQKMCARFTFVYRKDDKDWKIIEHHSSVMPAD